MRRPGRPEAHTLAGAYALDAVTGADRARFERHLARCHACTQELRELREAAARLAEAAAAEPPAGLIDRAVAVAARTTQLPPVTGRVRASGRTWPAGARRLALDAAAALLAGAAVSGALTAEHHLSAAQRSDHAIAEVLNAPDAVMLTSRVKAGGTATVVMSHRDRALVFTTHGLPALPAGHCYQLWLMGPRGDRPAAVLPAPERGMTSPVIATGLAAGDRIGLAVEPVGMPLHPPASPSLLLNLAALLP